MGVPTSKPARTSELPWIRRLRPSNPWKLAGTLWLRFWDSLRFSPLSRSSRPLAGSASRRRRKRRIRLPWLGVWPSHCAHAQRGTCTVRRRGNGIAAMPARLLFYSNMNLLRSWMNFKESRLIERKARDSNPHSPRGNRVSSAARPTVSGYLPVKFPGPGIEPGEPDL